MIKYIIFLYFLLFCSNTEFNTICKGKLSLKNMLVNHANYFLTNNMNLNNINNCKNKKFIIITYEILKHYDKKENQINIKIIILNHFNIILSSLFDDDIKNVFVTNIIYIFMDNIVDFIKILNKIISIKNEINLVSDNHTINSIISLTLDNHEIISNLNINNIIGYTNDEVTLFENINSGFKDIYSINSDNIKILKCLKHSEDINTKSIYYMLKEIIILYKEKDNKHVSTIINLAYIKDNSIDEYISDSDEENFF